MPDNELPQGQIYLPCISMWRPWSSWVAWGWKPIETRTHNRFKSLVGKRIGIHAARQFDVKSRHLANHYLTDGQARSAGRDEFHYPSGIICTAFVRDHRFLTHADAPLALIECATPRYGLFLEAIHRLETPIRCKGRQGIFRVICPSTVHGSHVDGVSSPTSVAMSSEKEKQSLGEPGGTNTK
jgi:hypothetical protein